MAVVRIVLSLLAIGMVGIYPPCAIGDERSAAEQVAIVTEVHGIASLVVTLNGKSETLRILTLADEEDLKAVSESWDAVTQRHERVISRPDIKRFLGNRALIMNFLQCLTPPGSKISLYGTRRHAKGGIGASVAFHSPMGQKFDLVSMMLSEGFAMPEPRLWGYAVSDTYPPTLDDSTVEYFYSVPRSDVGLWAGDRPRANGYIPFSIEDDPALAVPVPTFRFDTKSESEPRRGHRIGVTVIVRRAMDVGTIASEAWRINDEMRKLVSRYTAADLMADTFAMRVENEMLNRVASLPNSDAQQPIVTKVRVRIKTFEFGEEMGTPGLDHERVHLFNTGEPGENAERGGDGGAGGPGGGGGESR